MVTSIRADEPPLCGPGSKIRVSNACDVMQRPWGGDHTKRLVGTLVELDSEILRLQQRSSTDVTEIQRPCVDELEVSRGRKSKALQGAAVGFLTGAVAGAITILSCSSCELDEDEQLEAFLVFTGGGGVLFGLAGLGIGALIRTDQWEEVPLDRVQTSSNLDSPAGFVFQASVTFPLGLP
jgi:hypothetical protein